MLTSKLITKIIEKHSEIYLRANICSNSILINNEITYDTVMQRHLYSPLPPLSKVRGGSAPVMHPNSGVPEDDSSAFLKF